MLGDVGPVEQTVVHCIDLADARQHEGHHYPLSQLGGLVVPLDSDISPDQVVDCVKQQWPEGTPMGDLLRVYTEGYHVYVTLGSDEWAKAQLGFALKKI